MVFYAFPTPIPRAPRGSTVPSTPSRLSMSMARPKSTELPQFLSSYLSAVFDVDWSVDLPRTEDSLFIEKSATAPTPITTTTTTATTTTPAISTKAPAASSPSHTSTSTSINTSRANSSPKRISDSTASISSYSSSYRSSMASLSSSMTSVDGQSVDEPPVPVPSGVKLWDENGAIPILILAPSSSPSAADKSRAAFSSTTTHGTHKKNKGTAVNGTIKKDQGAAVGEVTKRDQGNATNGMDTKADGGHLKNGSTATHSPSLPLPYIPILKKQSTNTKPKATLVPGRRSSLMQTGQIPAVSSKPNNKNGQVSTVKEQNSAPLFPTVPSLPAVRPSHEDRDNVDIHTIPNNGLPRPLGSNPPVSAISTASPPAGGMTTISLATASSATTFATSYPPTPPSSLQGTLGGRTAKSGYHSPGDSKQQESSRQSYQHQPPQKPHQKSYTSYVMQSAPIVLPSFPSLTNAESVGRPPLKPRSPPQPPRQLAIVSHKGASTHAQSSGSSYNNDSTSGPTFATPSSHAPRSPPPRSPSRSHPSLTLPSSLPQLDSTLPGTSVRSPSKELQSHSYVGSLTLPASSSAQDKKTRPGVGYFFKASKSSPDLMSPDGAHQGFESYGIQGGGIPQLPNAPLQYYSEQQQQQQQQDGYRGEPDKNSNSSHSRANASRTGRPTVMTTFMSAPLPQLPTLKNHSSSSERQGRRNDSAGRGSAGSSNNNMNRWSSMKTMFGLKVGHK
ncbi:hypothetical protein BGZ94_001723 [Podila epigama]|nr:hypothetical protein BGZ94_001723 [Podila epigama]